MQAPKGADRHWEGFLQVPRQLRRSWNILWVFGYAFRCPHAFDSLFLTFSLAKGEVSRAAVTQRLPETGTGSTEDASFSLLAIPGCG